MDIEERQVRVIGLVIPWTLRLRPSLVSRWVGTRRRHTKVYRGQSLANSRCHRSGAWSGDLLADELIEGINNFGISSPYR